MLVAGWAAAQTVPAEPPASGAMPAASFPHHLLGEIQHEIAAVEPWLDRYGYGAVFAAVGVEGFGIPALGQTLLIAGAVTAATQTDFYIGLLLTAFLAAVLGSSLGKSCTNDSQTYPTPGSVMCCKSGFSRRRVRHSTGLSTCVNLVYPVRTVVKS
jgi:hypothetical protein